MTEPSRTNENATAPAESAPSLLERVTEMVERHQTSLDNPGICLACGAEHDGCEPDMRRGECEVCGAYKVYGAEEALMMLF
jgi:hypothetical protein